MRICLVNNLFIPLKAGGAEKVVENIAEILVKQGHDVVVLTIGVDNLEIESKNNYRIVRLINKFIYHRIDSDKQNVFKKIIFHWQNVFCSSHAKQAKSFFNTWKPDIVWTHNLSGFGWQINNIINETGARHWHELHDFQLINPFGTFLLSEKNELLNLPFIYKFYAILAKRSFVNLEIVISPSKFLLDEYKNNGFFGDCRTEVIPNPFIGQGTEVVPLKDGEIKKILYIGQLEGYKGVLTLVSAFSCLVSNDIELVLVGEGSLMNQLKEIAGKDSRIKILGWQSNEQVKELILSSQVVAYPSECYENLPTVIIESLSLGRPVLASNIGGINEMIDDKQTGWLVEAGNRGAWKNVLEKLTKKQQPLNDLSLRAIEVSKKYSIAEYTKLLSNLL